MSASTAPAEPQDQSTSKFLVFQSNRGLLTTPEGSEYDIHELRPHPTDPADPKSPIWYEGFLSAKGTDLHARDKLMQTAFDKTGEVPAHLPGESNARPLQLKLNPFPEDKKRPDGKSPDYIGSVLTSEGFYTVFARKQDGKAGLLLAGSVAPHIAKGTPTADAPSPQPVEPAGKPRKGPRATRDPA